MPSDHPPSAASLSSSANEDGAGVWIYLGLGSNLGDREAHVRGALAALAAVPGISVVRVSTLRDTAPVGGPTQPEFLNGVAELRTTLPPMAVLALCRELERRAGRDHGAPRNHPRPLDLDVLLWGDEVIDTRALVVPHPRMHARRFVLEPLAELGVTVPEPVLRPLVTGDATELALHCSGWLRGDCTLGLVATMGALHEGHASLLRTARAECDRVVGTVFVNPLQFGDGEDLDRYPRTLPADLEVLAAAGVDLVFAPNVQQMYPQGHCTRLSVGDEARGLEGDVRPGHFEGVATVVAKLLAMVRPTHAYFGRKDAQQVAVIRRMVTDLELPVQLRECETVRESDGLAMSSRNARLSPAGRSAAAQLFAALCAVRERHAAGERDAAALRALGLEVLARDPRVAVEYFELRREGDLAPLPEGPVVAGRLLVAAQVDDVRLIDNLSLAATEGSSAPPI
ncbi:MAG: pantoate--beta-alanine ligase [Planctomycetota bacterium]